MPAPHSRQPSYCHPRLTAPRQPLKKHRLMRRTRSKSSTDAAPGSKSRDHGLLRFLLILAVLAWAIRSFVVAPFSIPTGSMIPTLYIGEYLFVAKWPYGFSRYSFP